MFIPSWPAPILSLHMFTSNIITCQWFSWEKLGHCVLLWIQTFCHRLIAVKKKSKKSVNTFVVLFLFYWVYVLLKKILLSLFEGSFVLYVVEVEVLLYVYRNCRLIRDGSPGQPPQLSHSSWALYIYIWGFILFYFMCAFISFPSISILF